jgi:hypothetical protein
MRTPRSTSCHSTISAMIVVVVMFLAVLGPPPAARGVTCKADGASCRTNQACCGGACINGAPPGSKPFGVCCTPTTCSALGAECGSVSNGCGKTLDCGSCSAPATCGGDGTPNVCGTSSSSTTTTSTTTTSTSTTAASCGASDQACETACSVDADCPETRYCFNGVCQPRVTDHRACLHYDECFSGCCCGVHGFTSCGLLEGVCREQVDCGDFGEQCPGSPCGEDSQCYASQFCTAGQCYQKQQNGGECQYKTACLSGCCCVASGAATGVCSAGDSCGGDAACLP